MFLRRVRLYKIGIFNQIANFFEAVITVRYGREVILGYRTFDLHIFYL